MRHDEWANQSAGNNRSDLEAYVEELRVKGELPSIEPKVAVRPGTAESDAKTPETEGSQEPTEMPEATPEKPSFLRFYSFEEVLSWWRGYTMKPGDSDPDPVVKGFAPTGYRCAIGMAPDERRRFRRDVPFLAWLHVETFFQTHIRWAMSRPFLLIGDGRTGCGLECELALAAWYEAHPLMIVAAWQSDVEFRPEHVPYPLAEAVDRYNERVGKKLQRSYRSALDAAKDDPPRLEAWRPEGRWHTTLANIERWVASERRREGREAA